MDWQLQKPWREKSKRVANVVNPIQIHYYLPTEIEITIRFAIIVHLSADKRWCTSGVYFYFCPPVFYLKEAMAGLPLLDPPVTVDTFLPIIHITLI